MSTVVAVWNPASGNAPDEDDLREALGDDVELVATTEDDPGRGQTRDAVERGASTVVACGGDGTVRACIESVAGTDTALAVVPLGTGNLLASNLDVDPGLDGASARLTAPLRSLDVGRVNGERFAVMAGTGFDAFMIRDASSTAKRRFGRLAYVASGLRNLRRDLVTTTVEVDGEVWYRGRSAMVLLGNFGAISGGVRIFPEAAPDDGKLDVAVMAADGLSDWLAIAWRLVRGRDGDTYRLRRTQGLSIVATTDRPRPYELDGEVRPSTTRLSAEIEPGALRVRVEGRPCPS